MGRVGFDPATSRVLVRVKPAKLCHPCDMIQWRKLLLVRISLVSFDLLCKHALWVDVHVPGGGILTTCPPASELAPQKVSWYNFC